jgi:hypothetical protein
MSLVFVLPGDASSRQVWLVSFRALLRVVSWPPAIASSNLQAF